MPVSVYAPKYSLYSKPPVGAQLRAGHPLAQGLKAAWLFNEGGGVPRDIISGRPALLSSTIYTGAFNSVKKTSAAAGASVNTGDTYNAVLNNAYGTIVWAVNPTNTAGTTRMHWGHITSGSVPEMTGQIFLDNNWYVGWNSSGSDTRLVLASGAGNITVGIWQVYVYSWAPSRQRFLRNGMLLQSSTNTPTLTNPSGNFAWGGLTGSIAGMGADSYIGFGYIYSGKALSDAEAQWLAYDPFGMFESPRRWFTDTSQAATVVRDLIGVGIIPYPR